MKLTNQELADLLRKKYIPFAFTCDCAGNDIDCAEILKSNAMWTQHDVVLRIAKFIETLED